LRGEGLIGLLAEGTYGTTTALILKTKDAASLQDYWPISSATLSI
jgi:hypothetical protein